MSEILSEADTNPGGGKWIPALYDTTGELAWYGPNNPRRSSGRSMLNPQFVGVLINANPNSCGRHVKSIASIEAPVVVEKTLTHIDRNAAGDAARRLPWSRSPPSSMKT